MYYQGHNPQSPFTIAQVLLGLQLDLLLSPTQNTSSKQLKSANVLEGGAQSRRCVRKDNCLLYLIHALCLTDTEMRKVHFSSQKLQKVFNFGVFRRLRQIFVNSKEKKNFYHLGDTF